MDEKRRGGSVKLYAHNPQTLLKLLEAQLPYSLPIYGTIKLNTPTGQSSPNGSIIQEEHAGGTAAAAAATVAAAVGNGIEARERGWVLPDHQDRMEMGESGRFAWTTFPTSEIGSPPTEGWCVLIQLPPPQGSQLRIYCSLEKELDEMDLTRRQSLENIGDRGDVDRVEDVRERWQKRQRKGQELITGTLEVFRRSIGGLGKCGAVSTLWTDSLIRTLGTREMVSWDIWLAPILPYSVSEDRTDGSGTDGLRLEDSPEGFFVDECRLEDCELIQSTREIKEDIQYYHSRLQHISVIRPNLPQSNSTPNNHSLDTQTDHVSNCLNRNDDKPPAVGWVMTHSDGDIGALYTLEGYRGKGLAKAVVKHRMKKDQEAGKGVRAHAWTNGDNPASEAVWRSLGWKKGWSVKWVNLW